MASILRQIVAGPRARHAEAGLDLCYITDNLIATSGPSSSYPSRAYRNPIEDLVRFLDYKHGAHWAIWEFRAEGTGYPDEAVYGRVAHFPWPDHHPPPFALIPLILRGMHAWLTGDVKDPATAGAAGKRVAVVHCKAGKGRSGTVGCAYLMAEAGWAREAAQQRFTERRMRPGFTGITIPSQRRWLAYVERWRDHGKAYVAQAAEVLEVRVWGLRPGVKLAVEGYVDDGRAIAAFHVFKKEERQPASPALAHAATASSAATTSPTANAVFRPATPVRLPSADVNLACERRSAAAYGWALVTSVAHVWFNVFFEGRGPERCDPALGAAAGQPDADGVFEIGWDAMDGIKGSSRKGKRAFDRVAVVWRAVPVEAAAAEPPTKGGGVVPGLRKADREPSQEAVTGGLGLRKEAPDSEGVSRAASEGGAASEDEGDVGHESDVELTRPRGPDGEEELSPVPP